ncbi:MAG: MFS transporter [Treponemataceae bacterium]|nr:MAG: MFS transporter [Treponemataceae bacterium]
MKLFTDCYTDGAHFKRFLGTLILSGVAYGLYKGIQDNYLSEIVHIGAFERGIVEFCREIPGLLVVLLLALMYRFSESRIFKMGIVLMLAGVAGLAVSTAALGNIKLVVVLFMVVFSFGEHIIMPVRSTISLDIAKSGKGGVSLGITGSIGQIGNIVGYLLVSVIFFVFAKFGHTTGNVDGTVNVISVIPFRSVFVAATVLMLGSAGIALSMDKTKLKSQRKRFYFARKFKTYYILEVFYGARKQVFFTFAPYVIIRHYGASASVISLLLAVSALACAFFGPITGKIIDKIGYKPVMVADTLILIAVCFFYGFAHRLFPMNIAFIVVCVNYIFDAIISLASMATNVYVKSLSDSQEELTATLSTGISVNHVITLFIAVAGGLIWEKIGIEALFTLSAFFGLLNSLFAAAIKVKK